MWQYAIIGGKRYSHLIDPHTGMALTDHSNVTVVGPDGLSTDGLSSAVAILGPEKGLKLVEATPHSAAFIVRLVNGKEQTFQSKRWRDLPRGGKLAASPQRQYFAHAVVEDSFGVVAPWYRGQNGQCDWRLRITAETLKRYPWADKDLAVMAAPHFVFNGHWSIDPDGTIHVDPHLSDWDNGDVGQRSFNLLTGMTNYYRYTSDPAAIGLVTLVADYLLDFCQTPTNHPWPRFLISCPTKGKAYAAADPHGFIQLDLSAALGPPWSKRTS